MATVIVMPCLNEETLLRETCLSLGFGRGENSPTGRILVLVDNGSTDHTPEVMGAIRDQSQAGLVHVVRQAERGYVPARHAGMLLAAEISGPDTFVLQADADTLYAEDYVERMSRAFLAHPNCLIEGASVVHRDFRRRYPGFHRLCESVDADVIDRTVETDAVIVPDAVSGFSITNYFRWGGHQREYLPNGDELFAETTRMYIRARLMGCTRFRDPDALAFQSRRKVIESPGMYLSCAGFPRERQWRKRWQAAHPGRMTLEDFEAVDAGRRFSELLADRRCHLIALFSWLPVAVACLKLGDRSSENVDASEDQVASVGFATAPLFERAFELIDDPAAAEIWFSRVATKSG